MPRILVIGYGNTLRGDDGFGPLAAGLIAARAPAGVDVVVTHQLGPEHALDIRAADFVVFLDAAAAGEPGRLTAAPVTPRDLSPSSMSHGLDPARLLALTAAVYGPPPNAVLVTAAAADFEHGETISTAVRAAADEAAAVVVRFADDGSLAAEMLLTAFGTPA